MSIWPVTVSDMVGDSDVARAGGEWLSRSSVNTLDKDFFAGSKTTAIRDGYQ